MSKSKKDAKKSAATVDRATKSNKAAAAPRGEATKPILRAIRVTPDLLAAAKEYKKSTGTSFYALGLEAISERLVREGYLKTAETKAGA